MCMAWPAIALLVAFLINALMCIYKKKKSVKLISHDCLPIFMLLYIRLYIVLAYLMLLAALSNADCLYNAFLPLIFENSLCYHALSWFIDA